MKRTKEAHYRPNPSHDQTKESSGLTFLIGEDTPYYDRTRENQKLQKQYLDEQVQEKKNIKKNQKKTTTMFDQQILQNTYQRAQLQLEKHSRLHNMERAHDNYNLQQAEERKQREKQERQRELEEERREIELLNQRKIRRNLPQCSKK